MALTSNGLTNVGLGEGITANFHVQYESTLPNQATVIANANALLPVLENEFAVTTDWFTTPGGKFGSNNRQVVNLSLTGGGNNSGYGSAINVDAQSGNSNAADAAERVRMVFMNEWVEILMSLTGGKWRAGDSSGEGLSQFCGIVRFPTGHYSYYGSWVNKWLQTAPRPDWVRKTEPTDKNAISFGCALAFIFYLNRQLNFSINQIIAAGAADLATVYRNLTGDIADPFPTFSHQLDIVYPGTSTITGPELDNPYPIGKKILWHNSSTSETQFWFMDKGRVARRATVVGDTGAALVGPPWRIVGTNNMNNAGDWNITWHNSSTNETQIWFMNGEHIVRRASVVGDTGAAFVGLPWRVVGIGDMDGNGKADIVWHNSSTNETQIWFMNDEHIVRRATVAGDVGAAFVGPPWRIVGIGDMDGNGKADIVWHNSSTNETQIWFMNGEHIVRRATVVDESGAAFVGPPWRIVGTDDMAKDKRADIVWHNSSTNETQIWFMNGEHIARRATVGSETGAALFVGAPWRIVGTGDVYGDGIIDILWHNSTTNDVQFWFMDGPKIKGRNAVIDENGNIIRVGTPWNIAGVAGLAGESAMLWHNSTTNDIQFWFMDGPKIRGRNGVIDEKGNIIRVGAPWDIVGVTGLGGEYAILWHNSTTNDIQFWFMDGPKIKGRNGVIDESGSIIRIGSPWDIAGVSGLASESAILWHNSSTNDMQFWFMDGPKIKGRNGVIDENASVIRVGTPWNIAGVGGPASESKILWHNGSTNDMQFWFMDGPKIKGRNGVVDENGSVIRVGTPWSITGTGGA